ncbi:MAG: glycosyltransferase 87 family protein [bacterium]
MTPVSPTDQQHLFAAGIFLFCAVCIHLLFIGSLFSEPFAFEHNENLIGSRSHPQESAPFKGFLDSWFHDTDRVPRGLDFFSIYQAGRNFLRGQSVYYGVREHQLGEEALVVPYFSGFRYLPAYAVIFGTLLNILPPWLSYWAWILLVETLLLLNIYLIKWLPVSSSIKSIIAGMWLAYSPFYVEIHIGQQSMVTVTLLHLCIIAHLNRKPGIRNSAYIISALWKLNTLLFLPIWIKFKQWRPVLLLFLLIILSSVPYFVCVDKSYQEFQSYFHHKFIATGPNSLGFWAFFSQFLQAANLDHSMIKRILTNWSFVIYTFGIAATFIPRKTNFTLALAMWICVYFLTYQYVWEHHYVMMLPVFSAGMLFKNLRKFAVISWLFCALPTPYIVLNNPSLLMPQEKWNLLQSVFYHGTKIIPVLLLFFLLAISLFRNIGGLNAINSGDSQIDVYQIFHQVKKRLLKRAG